jgi:ABC-type transport system involved in cytochrome c biogenesis permease subunit
VILLRLVATLYGLLGLASVAILLMYLIYGPSFQTDYAFYSVVLFGIWAIHVLIGFTLLYGLWRSRRWARWLAIAVNTVYLVMGISGFVLARLRESPKMTVQVMVFGVAGLLLFGGMIVICARRPRP